jgi:putative SOS response-associated peptidase YedK
MCGRFTLTTPLEGLREVFGFLELPNLAPRANIAPTQEVLAVRLGEDAGRHATLLRWGLIPGWAKEAAIGAKMINARGESVAEKPAFRRAFKTRRCLVAADGFYEWQPRSKGPKQPYRIVRPDRGPFAFAGLWERWRDPAQAEAPALESCTIITTEANARLAPIHLRMPVILDPADFDLWLDPASPPAALQALLRPCPDEWLEAYPVSTRVNRVANDDLALLEPLAETPAPPPEPDQGRLL